MRALCLLILGVLAIGGGGASAAPDRELWFPVGEDLRYRLYWGIVPVGEARIWSEWVEVGGRRLVALRLEARTGRVVRTVYPVEDTVEALVDPDTFRSVRYTQVLREGRKRRDDVFDFDYEAGHVVHRDRRKGVVNSMPLDAETRDLLTFIYLMRAEGYAAGRVNSFRVLVEDKVYDLTLRGVREESLRLSNFGTFPTLLIEPEARFGEIFVRNGRVWAWFTDDDRKLCAKLVGKVPVADVKALLTEVRGPGDDRWVAGK